MRIFIAAALSAALAACGGHQNNGANDAYLTVAVKAKLATVDVDSATSVNVAVSNGTVTLTGQAHDPRERMAYAGAAKSVDGVRAVDDRLTIDRRLRGLRQQSQDAALAAKVAAAIGAQTGINVFQIKTTAHDGTVTLEGKVPTSSVLQTVVQTARGVSGVKRVVSRIAVSR